MILIPLSALEDIFDNMRSKTKWNVDGPMLWGYFFTDPDADKLRKAADHLTNDSLIFTLRTRVTPVYSMLNGPKLIRHRRSLTGMSICTM
jgi:hypothetical protein